MTSGGCLCGQVRYDIGAQMRPVIACHCTQCRKTSGHHVAASSVDRSAIAIRGDVTWYASSDTARRGFCGICGSNLFWDGPGQSLSIFVGALDGDSGLEMAGHIFCDDKGDYYEICDGLPQAAQDSQDLTTQAW